jgi:hypothetical protein
MLALPSEGSWYMLADEYERNCGVADGSGPFWSRKTPMRKMFTSWWRMPEIPVGGEGSMNVLALAPPSAP